MTNMSQDTVSVRPPGRFDLWRLVARGLLVSALVVPVALNVPGLLRAAQAAPLEDCDADGFDDATGAAVPWPGFDETHGDTPAGPGTAEWWIKQNQPTGGGGTTPNTSGGETPSSGSGSNSGGTSNSGGKTGTSSSSTKGGSTKSSSSSASSADAAQAAAATPLTAAAAAAVPTVAATAAVSANTASGTASVATTASSTSAESSAAVAGSTLGGPGAGTGTDDFNLWEAMTVGFTSQNTELFAGLSLLAGLALAGGLAMGIGAWRRMDRTSFAHETATLHLVEEPSTGSA